MTGGGGGTGEEGERGRQTRSLKTHSRRGPGWEVDLSRTVGGRVSGRQGQWTVEVGVWKSRPTEEGDDSGLSGKEGVRRDRQEGRYVRFRT